MAERITSLKQLTIDSILKVDPFDQKIDLFDEEVFEVKPLIDRNTFFENVYDELKSKTVILTRS